MSAYFSHFLVAASSAILLLLLLLVLLLHTWQQNIKDKGQQKQRKSKLNTKLQNTYIVIRH